MSEHLPSKPHTVDLFNEVAPKYEFLNTLMTAGRDRVWRTVMLNTCESALGRKPAVAMDLATGTGDVARMMASRWQNAQIIGSDPTPGMLDLAKSRSLEKKSPHAWKKILWKEGVAESINAEDDSIEVLTIAFGFRNVSESMRAKATQEAFRVLKPGGVFAILELGTPSNKAWQPLYKILLKKGMPRFASLFGPKSAYEYLAQSILDFPSPEKIKKMLNNSGFLAFAPKELTLGMAWLYVGKKPQLE